MEENKIRDLINKHLEFKSGLEVESVRFYADYGKVSGSMFLNVKTLINECLSEKQTRIDDLEIVSQIQSDELIKNFARIKELEEALKFRNDLLEALRPYVHDLEKDNRHDPPVGIFYDEVLGQIHMTLLTLDTTQTK